MSHPSEQDLVLFALGDLEESEGLAVHVGECARCREELAAVRRLLAMTEQLPVPDPDSGFEGRIWRYQRRHLRAASGDTATSRAWQRAVTLSPERRRVWSTSRTGLVGAMAALVAVAFLVGRSSAPRGDGAGVAGSGADVTSTSAAGGERTARNRILLVAVGDHLKRARMVLVELVNAAPATDGLDLSMQQARAEQLLGDNRLYRQTATLQGRSDVADVLEEVERVLVELARGTGPMQPAEVGWLRQRIQSRDLLFKVSVIEERAHRDEESSERPREPL